MKKLKVVVTLGLLPIFLIIKNIEVGNSVVEKYYSDFFYLYISEKLRFITGWISIPIGDLLYLFIILSLIYFVFFRIKKSTNILLNLGSSAFIFIFLFYVLWGLNYKRVPVKDHLNVDGNFEIKELTDFTETLIDKINKKHIFLFKNDSVRPINEYSFTESIEISKNNIDKLKEKLKKPIIKSDYKNVSVKKSLFSLPLTYMGFSGYINPFTNEANINYKIPSTSLIFVINHEIAHQLGIASEKDANFISYLMLISSDDEYLKYCGLSYALRLCLNELSKLDYDKYQYLSQEVNKGIIKDFVEINKFWKNYEGKIEKVSKKSYDLYLKQNNIQSGIKNYNESISLILKYKFQTNEQKNNQFR
jgi:hypothetical protein